jgi:uncharacterized membrane protein (DUF485 family)
MFNYDTFKQKSPQQRFLFILGLAMIVVFITLAVLIVFFGNAINLDPNRFPPQYRIAFGVVLVLYALIRFFRIIKDNN